MTSSCAVHNGCRYFHRGKSRREARCRCVPVTPREKRLYSGDSFDYSKATEAESGTANSSTGTLWSGFGNRKSLAGELVYAFSPANASQTPVPVHQITCTGLRVYEPPAQRRKKEKEGTGGWLVRTIVVVDTGRISKFREVD